MKIAIEAQRIFRKNKHGMDFVALELIKQIQKIDLNNIYYIFVRSGDDRCLEESDNMKIIEVNCPTYPLWEQVALPLAVSKINPDILHCTSNTAPFFCPWRLILTLHDIIFLEPRSMKNNSLYQNLGFYYRKFLVPRNVKQSSLVLTVSNFERSRIESYFHNRVGVLKNSYGDHFRHIKNTYEVTKKYIEAEKYLFFMGNTDPKKNTLTTLQGYACYARKYEKPLPLLLANLPQNEFERLVKIGGIDDVAKHIKLSGYISNSDLPFIYSGSEAYLYTSLRESFGIPLLEAMATGTPVISSNNSAIPEIAGDAALLIDPTSAESISWAIEEITTNRELREAKIAAGYERIKLYSWEKSAEKLIQIYRNHAQ